MLLDVSPFPHFCLAACSKYQIYVDTSIMLMLRRMLGRMRMSLIMSLADFCLTDSLREECGHHQSQAGMGAESAFSVHACAVHLLALKTFL